jgi:uncharacterized coiled-coil DUF342 family protein
MFEKITGSNPETREALEKKVGVYQRFVEELRQLRADAVEIAEAEERLRQIEGRLASLPEESGIDDTPINLEEIKNQLSVLYARAEELRSLAQESGENIDAPLGSDEYIDHGYTAELRDNVQPEIDRLESLLKDASDADANQRELPL